MNIILKCMEIKEDPLEETVFASCPGIGNDELLCQNLHNLQKLSHKSMLKELRFSEHDYADRMSAVVFSKKVYFINKKYIKCNFFDHIQNNCCIFNTCYNLGYYDSEINELRLESKYMASAIHKRILKLQEKLSKNKLIDGKIEMRIIYTKVETANIINSSPSYLYCFPKGSFKSLFNKYQIQKKILKSKINNTQNKNSKCKKASKNQKIIAIKTTQNIFITQNELNDML